MRRSSRTLKSSWRRSSSASRPTSQKVWSVPPSSASHGAASCPIDHGFRSRYRAFHKNTAPMLGFFKSEYRGAPFISTTKFRPRDPIHCYDHSRVVDCRHGRALLSCYLDKDKRKLCLVVWDPMTGKVRKLLLPRMDCAQIDWTASVLCAVDGCNHVSCHLGPFFVVLFTLVEHGGEGGGGVTAAVYSSETSTWSSPSYLDLGFFEDELYLPRITTLLTGGVLHFLFVRDDLAGIVKYDLGTSCLSEVELQLEIFVPDCNRSPILIPPEEDDGRLGIAYLDQYSLDVSLWWREVGPDQVAAWTQPTVINLKNHLRADRPKALGWVVGSIEGTATIFVTRTTTINWKGDMTNLGTYKVDLKLLSSGKLNLSREFSLYRGLNTLFPYFRFYTPPVAQIEKLGDSGESETGSSDEEMEESEGGTSDEEMEESEGGTSDEEMEESEAGSSDDQ
ncbi:hypothetical protein D1007_25932 [Hordeum vulgare]|nr:hypothetical protein D1007_25932 [Hordeum vulgare]